MVVSLFWIITPSSAQKYNPLDPFPFGHLQFCIFSLIDWLFKIEIDYYGRFHGHKVNSKSAFFQQ